MGMTMTQKILAKHAGLESVTAGQLIEANVDLTLANDITGPVAIREMEKAGFDKVFDNTKIALVMDHFTPRRLPQIRKTTSTTHCITTVSVRRNSVHFSQTGRRAISRSRRMNRRIPCCGRHACSISAI